MNHQWLPHNKLSLWLVGILGFIFSLGFSLWYFQDTPMLSPLSSLTTFKFINQDTPKSEGKVVYGFLPYWNLDEVQLQSELTTLAYFGLTMGGDGRIITHADGGLEPGYRELQSEDFLELSVLMEEHGKRVELVLTQFDNDTIVSLLTNPQATTNLLQSLDSILLAYPVHGINIDLEYTGLATNQLRTKLVELVTTIKQHLDQTYQGIELSIDIYASAASQRQIWDVAQLQSQVDYMVVMAYDFHRRSSPQAGPVAPLFGGKEYWDSDINQHLADLTKIVPKHKLLLGVPFYGYEWQTTSREAQAHTFPETGSTASFKRVKTILEQKEKLQVEQNWSEQALSPYLSYVKDGEIYVIYYENSRSLSYKLDYVNQLDLGGIAIWALGYEDTARELWDTIQHKL